MKAIVLGGLVILLVVSISLGWFYMDSCKAELNSCSFGRCCEGLECCSDKICRTNCCRGTLIFRVSPEEAIVGETLDITVSGLKDCAGKEIYIKDNGVLVCTIESEKTGGTCQINASSVVGTHVFTAEMDMDMDGNISENEQVSQLVSIEDVCEGAVSLNIPSAIIPGTNVTARLSGIIGCSDRNFIVTVDGSQVCEGNISNNAGTCVFTAPTATKDYIVRLFLDMNNDGTTTNAGESDEKIMKVDYVCGGSLSFSMTDLVAPNTTVTATLSGYSHCEGKRTYLRQNNCSGAEMGYCSTTGTSCSVSFKASAEAGNYVYYFCFDMDGNTIFSSNEQASRTLRVGCIGNLSLALSPSTAEPNITVNATVSGLTGCAGKIVNVTHNNTLLCSINLSEANFCTFSSANEEGTYVVTAKIDKEGSNTANATLVVASVLKFSETRLTDNTADQTNPRIYNDIVVYGDNRHNDSEIYSLLIGGSETRITDNEHSQSFPAVWGNYIAWVDNRHGNTEIYMWNGVSETRITDIDSYKANPVIHENLIVWNDDRNDNYDIYSYNILTSTETRITSGTSEKMFPAVYGSKIVWQDNRNGNWDIYMWDGYEIQVTNNTADQSRPAVYGSNVIYQDNRNGNWDIYMWNGSAETRITTNNQNQMQPSIYGNYIVWQDNRNGNLDIYVYDLARKTETRLTNNTADQMLPNIYGNKIVFQDNRNTTYDIYMITLS